LEPFLTDDECKATREFEGVLRETSRLTSVNQNEGKLNSACGRVMRKNLHDSSSRDSIALTTVDQWSLNEMQTHLTRLDAKVESFALAGKICRRRVLLETERRFFNNESEETFAVSNAEIVMNFTDREKATLLLDPMTDWNSRALSDASEWCECKEELKNYCRAHCLETKAFYRRKNDKDKNEPSPARTDADESSESEQESDDCARLVFDRVVPDEAPVNDKPITEQQKRRNETIAADKEHERVVSNWIQCKPRHRCSHTKNELNLETNDETCLCKHFGAQT